MCVVNESFCHLKLKICLILESNSFKFSKTEIFFSFNEEHLKMTKLSALFFGKFSNRTQLKIKIRSEWFGVKL